MNLQNNHSMQQFFFQSAMSKKQKPKKKTDRVNIGIKTA